MRTNIYFYFVCRFLIIAFVLWQQRMNQEAGRIIYTTITSTNINVDSNENENIIIIICLH